MNKLFVPFLLTLCLFSKLMCAENINWSKPVYISTEATDASNASIVIDVDGDVTAIWVENQQVKTSFQPVNGSWTKPTTLSVSIASSPHLGIDSVGNVMAIWLDDDTVYSSYSSFKSGMWSTAKPISEKGASSPSLAVATNGNAVSVWIRAGSIESSIQPFGDAWGTVIPLPSNTKSSSPDVAIGNDGTIVAVWHSVVSGIHMVFSSTSSIQGNWGPALNIAENATAFSDDLPNVAVDMDGNAIVLWTRYELDNSIYEKINVLTASLLKNSGTWSDAVILSEAGEIVDLSLLSKKVVFDINGNAIAMWGISYDGSNFNIETSTKPIGGNWIQPVDLQATVLYAFQEDITVNNAIIDSGDVLAVYMIFDGSSSVIIQAQESNLAAPVTAGWSEPFTISTGSKNGYPRAATSLKNEMIYAAALWICNDGKNNRIAASTGSKKTLSSPTDLAVVQDVEDFGVFINYYNTISWKPSPSPNILKYNIYRNGIYFTSVDYFVSEVIDCNAIQNGPITYGVSAEDSSLDLSPIAEVNFP